MSQLTQVLSEYQRYYHKRRKTRMMRKLWQSARIERWVLRLQPYSFNVVYKPGSDNPADYLSRHPTRTSLKQQKLTEEYVNYLTRNSVPKAIT